MNKDEKKSNNAVKIVIFAIIAIVVIGAIAFMFTKKENNPSSASVEQTQTQNTKNLGSLQDRINAQENTINDLNQKLTPLVEERTKLERQLTELISSETVTTEVVEPVEETNPVEETVQEITDTENSEEE